MPRPPQLVEVEALNKVIKKVDDRFAEHARHLEAFRRLEGEVVIDRQIQAQRELADKFQAQVVSYTNVVVGFGYAGFFALWNMVGKAMPAWAHSAAGLLIGASLALYVGWEVVRMIWTAFYVRAGHKQLNARDGQLTVNALVNLSQKLDRQTFAPWLAVMVPTLLLAVAGAGLVLFFLGKDLIAKLAL